jgi:hypothetical protein
MACPERILVMKLGFAIPIVGSAMRGLLTVVVKHAGAQQISERSVCW